VKEFDRKGKKEGAKKGKRGHEGLTRKKRNPGLHRDSKGVSKKPASGEEPQKEHNHREEKIRTGRDVPI